jgi:hypothetical protein
MLSNVVAAHLDTSETGAATTTPSTRISPFPDPIARERNVGELLTILTGPPATDLRDRRSETNG